jgi:phosphatidylglycerol:prolipoprotein diacylglycerol transferase
MSVDQFGIHIGPLYIRFYALALLAGILAGATLTAYRAKRRGEDPEQVWNGLIWVVLGGIIGARIYHVLTPPPSMGITALDYLKSPMDVIAIWKGGLGVPGALVGGGLAACGFTRRAGLYFWVWIDLIIPGVALGQAIGRLGNYVNQELYGLPSDLPWAVSIRPENRVAGYEAYERFHPMFLYEAIMNLAICGGLLWIERRFPNRLVPGDLLGLYVIFYASGRFFLEFYKLDAPAAVQGLTTAQIVSLAAVFLAVVFLFVRHRVVAGQSSTEPAR